MRTISHRTALVLLVGALGLTACTSNEPTATPTEGSTSDPVTETPSTSPTPTPTDATTPTEPEDPEAAARADIAEVFTAYTRAKAKALQEGPTPPVLVEHLEGIATGSWIIELQNGYGPSPVPVADPPTYEPMTTTDLDMDAGTGVGTSCYGPVRVAGELRMVVAAIAFVRSDGTWLVDGDRPDGASSCDG